MVAGFELKPIGAFPSDWDENLGKLTWQANYLTRLGLVVCFFLITFMELIIMVNFDDIFNDTPQAQAMKAELEALEARCDEIVAESEANVVNNRAEREVMNDELMNNGFLDTESRNEKSVRVHRPLKSISARMVGHNVKAPYGLHHGGLLSLVYVNDVAGFLSSI